MASKIILSSDEAVCCPKCKHNFPLREGITQKTIEQYEADYEAQFQQEREELRDQLTKEAERKAQKDASEQLHKLTEQLNDTKSKVSEAEAKAIKAAAEATAKAKADLELQQKALTEELEEKNQKIREFQKQQLALLQEKKKLQEAKESQELELQQKLDAERTKMRDQAMLAAGQKFELKEAEYKKKIEDAQKANEVLSRKLEQGSQQLQGEVLELELEHTLVTGFPQDRIEEVKKGVRGADVIHTVCTPTGQVCGKIVWEAKRAENWSEKWLQKLKDDQHEAKADIAVLVTTAMPKGLQEPFCRLGEVWLVAPHAVKPVAEILRVVLLRCHEMKLKNTGKNEKMELVYNYLSSQQFAQKLKTVIETFDSMKAQLGKEKAAVQKIWAKRETQIERGSVSVFGICGELQAIVENTLPALDAMKQLEALGHEDAFVI